MKNGRVNQLQIAENRLLDIDKLQVVRKGKKISQKKLAEMTGLSIGTIQGYEQGKFSPKKESLERIYSALDIQSDDLKYLDMEKKKMKIDEGSINHNALRMIWDLVEDRHGYNDIPEVMCMTLGEIGGIIMMAKAMKEVLEA